VNSLARKTLVGFVWLVLTLGLLLFVPARTFDFPAAWIYLSVFTVSAALVTAYLWKYDPKLLERRVRAGPRAEGERMQKRIQIFASFAFVGILVLPSLDHRFGWSHAALRVMVAGDLLVVIGFAIVFAVFRANTLSAATIEVASDQHVVSTGPYATVRHPTYAGALLMLLGTPLALGSWWGLLMFVPMALTIAWRLAEEEAFLTKQLPGYAEYRNTVRHRLIPFVGSVTQFTTWHIFKMTAFEELRGGVSR
jgi:protein-S-isoprenylcysteine O-methyltransferase Ste14